MVLAQLLRCRRIIVAKLPAGTLHSCIRGFSAILAKLPLYSRIILAKLPDGLLRGLADSCHSVPIFGGTRLHWIRTMVSTAILDIAAYGFSEMTVPFWMANGVRRYCRFRMPGLDISFYCRYGAASARNAGQVLLLRGHGR